jgi:hypothetical protein
MDGVPDPALLARLANEFFAALPLPRPICSRCRRRYTT